MALKVGELYASLNLKTDRYNKGISKARRGAQMLGKALVAGTAVAGAAMAGVGVAATKAAASFEEAMVGIEKVTDPETAKQMRIEIMEMADEMPATHEELAAISEEGARLGIRGAENIRNFTRVVAEMDTATDLAGTEASNSLAKIQSLTDTGVDEFRELGSATNELANNMAASTSEIVNSTVRSAGSLDAFGMKSEEILGLNAAMNTVTATSRLAGSALRVAAQKLMKPKVVNKVSEALDMSAEKFKKIREESPVKLFKMLATEISEGSKAGEQLRSILGASAGDLGKLGKNWDRVEEAIGMAMEQYENATSLSEEYETAQNTLNAQMAILKNQFRGTMIAMGKELIPEFKTLIGIVQDNKEEIRAFATNSMRSIINFGKTVFNTFSSVKDWVSDLAQAFEQGGIGGAIDKILDDLEGIDKQLPIKLEPIISFTKNIIKTIESDDKIKNLEKTGIESPLLFNVGALAVSWGAWKASQVAARVLSAAPWSGALTLGGAAGVAALIVMGSLSVKWKKDPSTVIEESLEEKTGEEVDLHPDTKGLIDMTFELAEGLMPLGILEDVDQAIKKWNEDPPRIDWTETFNVPELPGWLKFLIDPDNYSISFDFSFPKPPGWLSGFLGWVTGKGSNTTGSSDEGYKSILPSGLDTGTRNPLTVTDNSTYNTNVQIDATIDNSQRIRELAREIERIRSGIARGGGIKQRFER